jgi:hypothetical protein
LPSLGVRRLLSKLFKFQASSPKPLGRLAGMFKIKRTYPLQNGSENPLDLTAVKFLASLINTCSWPLSPGIFGFFTFFLVGDGVGTSIFGF